MEPILKIENLKTSFMTGNGEVQAVRGVSFTVGKGEILGLVGESGSGKSVTAMSVLRLLADTARIKEGTITFEGQDLIQMPKKELRKIRGERISMIFQDPMSSLNPLIPVGRQVEEMIKEHDPGRKKEEVKEDVLELFRKVRIPEPEKRYKCFPHEFSGGMRQRVVIAIAIACAPQILICDEPTTALDVTIQAQILDLLKTLRHKYRLSIILITHDLGVVANIADRVAVMYAGDIIESGTSEDIFYDPRHPYTQALLSSLPQIGVKGTDLFSIPGTPPNLFTEIKGDAFAPRNPKALKIDFLKAPPYFEISSTHRAKTWLLDPRAPKVDPPEVVEKIRNGGLV